MAVTATQVESLYLAYFGRPAEPAGLTYWTAQTNATVDQISAAFAQQPEYTSVYGNLTRSQVVNTLYQNLFGRAAQSNELNYWVNSTDVTVDRLALALTNGATGTDRLTLDSKTQVASFLTTNAASTATATDVKTALNSAVLPSTNQTLTAYLNASTSNTVSGFYSQLAVQQPNTQKFIVTASTAADANGNAIPTSGINFGGATTAGSIALQGATGAIGTLTLAAANKATDVTVAGTSGTAAGTSAAATSFSLAENANAATPIVTTLHLNISDAAVAASSNAVGVSGLTALTTIDAANSTSALTINSSTLASLANITTGSGNDTLTVATTATNAVAQTVNSGAGNDVITATVGSAALTVNSGDGNDVLTVTTGNANLTVSTGTGNDLVTLKAIASTSGTTHVASIDLGAGTDTLKVGTANSEFANLHSAPNSTTATNATLLAQDLIKVANFHTGDKLDLSSVDSFQALSSTGAANVAQASTLLAAATAAASDVNGANNTAHTTAFQFGGNTYVLHADATGGFGSSGDGLIELTGYQGSFSTGTATGVLVAS